MRIFYVVFLVALFCLIPACGEDPEVKEERLGLSSDTILIKAPIDTAFSTNLSNWLNKINHSKNITWSVVGNTKPNWLEINVNTGRMWGTPRERDLGESFFVVALHSEDYREYAEIVLLVHRPFENHPPRWLRDPIRFETICHGVSFRFNLNSVVRDANGDTLSFEMESTFLPDVKLSPDGWLSLSVLEPWEGMYQLRIRASDGALSTSVVGYLTIDECDK